MKTRVQLILIFCGHLAIALGDGAKACAVDQPAWVLAVPQADARYFYYVGTSSDAKTLAAAKEEAYKNAVAEAIRDRYGVVTQIENEQYLTESNSLATTRIRESSMSVRIRGFEKLDSFAERLGGQLHVSSLYRYSKAEIANEKNRLSEIAPTIPESTKTIEGATFTTDLTLTSEPNGATVWINDLPLGQTPLHVKGLLPPGPVHVKFDQPFFETEIRELALISGEASHVEALLRPSHASLVFDTLPKNTDILIDRQAQKADSQKFELIAGKPYRIEVRNANYQPMLFEALVFDRDETKTISTPLIPKPARVKISTLPSNAKLSFNGRDVGFSPYSGALLPGNYEVLATVAGYAPTQLTLRVMPNENVTQVIRLQKQIEQRRRSTIDQVATPSTDESNPTLISLGVEASGPQFTRLDVPMARATAVVKTIGQSWFGYGLGLSVGTGEGRVGLYDVTVTENLGVTLNLNHEFQVFGLRLEAGAEPGYHAGDVTLKVRGSNTTVSQKPWRQFSLSGYLGLSIPLKNSGLVQLQLGARDSSNCDSLQGTKTWFLNLSWGGFL